MKQITKNNVKKILLLFCHYHFFVMNAELHFLFNFYGLSESTGDSYVDILDYYLERELPKKSTFDIFL